MENTDIKEKNITEKRNIEEKFRDWLAWWPWAHEIYLKYEEILVYLIVGGMTTVFSYLCKFGFNFLAFGGAKHPTSFQNVVLSTIAWVSGVIFAFFTNRKYVFKSREPMLPEAGKFVTSRISTYILDVIIMQLLGNLMGINVYIASIISAVLVVIANYIFSKLFVFNKNEKGEA